MASFPSLATHQPFQQLLSLLLQVLRLRRPFEQSAGGILYLIYPSLWLSLLASVLLLVAIDGVILVLATLAYQRFDVSLHTPA